MRRRPPDESLVCLSASDPANLLGTVVPGTRIARVAGSRVLYRDGVPIATSVADQIEILVPMSAAEENAARRELSLSPALRSTHRATESST
jgi:ATP-dependent Lhr-like helicase